MDLPNADQAIVEYKKIAEYLLNPSHPEGAGKAVFFLDLGFRVEDWNILAEAFRRLAVESTVSYCIESHHGAKYIIDGVIRGPIGKNSSIRTVWIINRDTVAPRLVTAYPWKSKVAEYD